MAEHLRDNALYMAFAPADKPTIAVALVVENAGFGAQSAAPIVRRVFDYWLQNLYPVDEDIAAVQVGQAAAPLRPSKPVAEASNVRIAAPVVTAASAAAAAEAASAVAARASQTGTP